MNFLKKVFQKLIIFLKVLFFFLKFISSEKRFKMSTNKMKKTYLNFLQIFLISLSISHVKSAESCGQLMQSSDTNSTIANWPWLASLFHYFNGQYFCSGTLISDRHILTGKIVACCRFWHL